MAQPKSETPISKNTKTNRRLLYVVGSVLSVMVILLIGWLIANQLRHSQDKKASDNYVQVVTSETDCAKVMSRLGGNNGSSPQTSSKIFIVKITCSTELGNYDQALGYIAKLEKIYKDNPSLTRYIDTNSARQQVAENKANSSGSTSVQKTSEPKKQGFQPDGIYYGP